jgi:transposase-like protein
MVRNSLRYSSKKHWSRITAAMREIYTAPTVEAAEARFAEFAGEWQQLYPAMIQVWRSVWQEFVPFLEFPIELRTVVYMTNAIESLNAALPTRRSASRSLPPRAGRAQGALPRRDAAAQESFRPDREDQRLEDDPQHPCTTRPDRSEHHQLKFHESHNHLHKQSDSPSEPR